ncbi:hypothetical protein C4N20_05625 [Fusobacterium ulcerans]|jgi:hypothetical protein|uniref:Uncharacterized protein n=2 Tax=Fusobacterium ulcerans TaxID=861 RepID=A0AAX2JHC2_9FUSO|nr:hypothetical protein [Fusobacterium ulcerans]AVQ27578.1 hypothetical protein C4N20_05625 [Fusobacterium ulcerans]EFS27362.2 hypothetical protein FUAG_02877 [Fusobacterium ulcerans ATCC 49185]SQJ15517.1 Uncharacterised protein [Fusobacterium ulcerans]
MFQKTVLNVVSSFLPDILRKYLQPEEVDQIMADVEKERLQVFSKFLERGGILHLFYVYSILVIFHHIITPYLTAFMGVEIYSLPIPGELTALIGSLGAVILGKKHLDKKLKN